MTRAHGKHADAEFITASVFRRLRDSVSVVLAVAGWKESFSGWGNTNQAVEARFSPDLSRLAASIVKLDRAIGEGILSKDVTLVTVAEGVDFDAKTMDDAYGVAGNVGSGLVACTCDLGLQTSFRGPLGKDVTNSLPLKPKVVLLSALKDGHQ